MILPLLLLACSTPPDHAPAGTAVFADSLTAPAARACFDKACGDAPDAPACFASACPQREEAWRLVPQKVQWDDSEQIFFLEAHVAYTPAGWGDVDVVREEPVFVGVTLRTPEGEEIDLAIATRFPGAFEEPFFISSEIGKPVQDLIVGVWDRKIEPCDDARPGCQLFGFLLDGPMASWPAGFYTTMEWQRIPPTTLALLPFSGGANTAELEAATEQAKQQLESLLAPFGTTLTLGNAALAGAPVEHSTVRAGSIQDQALARMLAEALGGQGAGWERAELVEGDAADSLTLVVSGPAEHHACLAEHCADASDLTTCEAASCQ